MSHNIKCKFHNNEIREWEITVEGKVWPCFRFGNAWEFRNSEDVSEANMLFSDDEFKKIMKDDPEWNDLHKHDLNTITSHTYYWTKIWYPGWESSSPHPLCIDECGVKTNET